jgi:hypothetical protein
VGGYPPGPDALALAVGPVHDGRRRPGRYLADAGRFVSCNALRSSGEAKTVHIRGDGASVVTDGPYVEAKEVVGGYYIIECPTMEEAVGWAKQLPNPFGAVEVRPILDME